MLGRLDRHRILPGDPPCFPVVGVEREPVFGRIYVIGDAEVPVSQLVLEEVDEPQRPEFRFPHDLRPAFRVHVQVFREIVVGENGPVDHQVPVRQPAVGEHHVRTPELLSIGIEAVPVVREGVVAAAPVQVDVIAFRLGNTHVVVVFLDDGDIGEVLGADPVPELFRAHFFRDVAQFRAVDEDPGPDGGSVGQAEGPPATAADDLLRDRPETDPDPGFAGHVFQHFRADGRIEQDVGHPARFQRLIAPVPGRERVCEFSENAAPEAVVPVHGAHAGGREHAAQPGRGLHDQGPGAVARRLDGGGRPSGTPAGHDDVVNRRAGEDGQEQSKCQMVFHLLQIYGIMLIFEVHSHTHFKPTQVLIRNPDKTTLNKSKSAI